MRPLATIAVLALALPTSGCCSLARLFCGPDKSEWVSVDFRTPKKALLTLLEAFRRDDADVVASSLTDRFYREKKVDSLGLKVFYQRMKEETPGLHLVGYAEIPEPTFQGGRATFVLDVEGTVLVVALARETVWDVRFRRPNGTLGETGDRVSSLQGLADVELMPGDEDRSRVVLQPMIFRHDGLDDVPLEAIESAGVRRQWKVDGFTVRQ